MNTDIAEEKIISNPMTVAILFHKQKQQILELLIKQEMNIIEIKNATKMNPGTVKRHITALVDHDLVKQTNIKKNFRNITEKFYRTSAKKFIIYIEWPNK